MSDVGELDLNAIRARHEVGNPWPGTVVPSLDFLIHSHADMAALLAEVERVRSDLAAANTVIGRVRTLRDDWLGEPPGDISDHSTMIFFDEAAELLGAALDGEAT